VASQIIWHTKRGWQLIHERILTVVQTLRQQRRSVLDYLEKTCCANLIMTTENISNLNIEKNGLLLISYL
jgi:hypothetical protein